MENSREELKRILIECLKREEGERYYAWDGREVMIFLRLKGYGESEAATPRPRRAEEENDPPCPIGCSKRG